MILRAIFKGATTFHHAQCFVGAAELNVVSIFVCTQFVRNGIACHSQYHSHRSLSESKWQSSKHIHQLDVPQSSPKVQRKRFATAMRGAEEEKNISRRLEQKVLNHSKNGLLVPEVIQVSHEVYQARNTLLRGVTKLLNVLSVHKCRFCPEVYIGHEGHELKTCKGPKSGSRNSLHEWTKGTMEHVLPPVECFHLYDMVGNPPVTHFQRLKINRIPAVVELCVQAGLDLKDCPTKRMVCPGNMVAGKITGIELSAPPGDSISSEYLHMKEMAIKDDISLSNEEEIQEMGDRTLEAWERMKAGTRVLMRKYPVKTCRYCPEVQVGPKGHKVGMCKGPNHQYRQGQHAWKKAILDDLIPPVYVVHVPDTNGPPLKNKLKKYYGKAPALIELCVQAGTAVPNEYKSMTRFNVAMPKV